VLAIGRYTNCHLRQQAIHPLSEWTRNSPAYVSAFNVAQAHIIAVNAKGLSADDSPVYRHQPLRERIAMRKAHDIYNADTLQS
jgi:hypothetical protein